MVAIAQPGPPDGLAIVRDAVRFVVADRAFDRVSASHFYSQNAGITPNRLNAIAG